MWLCTLSVAPDLVAGYVISAVDVDGLCAILSAVTDFCLVWIVLQVRTTNDEVLMV